MCSYNYIYLKDNKMVKKGDKKEVTPKQAPTVNDKSKGIKKDDGKNGTDSPARINEVRGKEMEIIMKDPPTTGYTTKDPVEYFELDTKYH